MANELLHPLTTEHVLSSSIQNVLRCFFSLSLFLLPSVFRALGLLFVADFFPSSSISYCRHWTVHWQGCFSIHWFMVHRIAYCAFNATNLLKRRFNTEHFLTKDCEVLSLFRKWIRRKMESVLSLPEQKNRTRNRRNGEREMERFQSKRMCNRHKELARWIEPFLWYATSESSSFSLQFFFFIVLFSEKTCASSMQQWPAWWSINSVHSNACNGRTTTKTFNRWIDSKYNNCTFVAGNFCTTQKILKKLKCIYPVQWNWSKCIYLPISMEMEMILFFLVNQGNNHLPKPVAISDFLSMRKSSCELMCALFSVWPWFSWRESVWIHILEPMVL